MTKLDDELRPLATEHASFLRCVDKAGRHATGEAVHLFANLILKKREHIMSLAYNNVPKATINNLIYAPLIDCQLLPVAYTQEVVLKFRQQTETSALASVAAVARTQGSSSSFFRGASSSFPAPASFRGKRSYRGPNGSGGKSSGLSAKNREFFNRRDKYARGRGNRRN